MKDLVQNFTEQLRQALAIAEKAVISPTPGVKNIVVSGLGGSGIGGTIVSELVSEACPVPITVVKDYTLPAFAGPDTLLICSSYSGNTEETLAVVEQGLARKAQIAVVTSGGKLLDMARQNQFDFIEIPGGLPPRSCIGYSLVQLLQVLIAKGLARPELMNDLASAVNLLDRERTAIQAEAQRIAAGLKDKIPVLYSLGCEGVTIRFRQQINENSKMLCWHHTLPEMNHNELVGWTVRNEHLAVVTFHTAYDHARTVRRYEICRPIFEKYSSGVYDITAQGQSKSEQFMYLIHIGDWISCYLADLRQIDPVEVRIIDHLKRELTKF